MNGSSLFLSPLNSNNSDGHYFDNVSRMSYLFGNDNVLGRPPALIIDMTGDYKHYLEGKLGLTIFFCVLLSFSAVIGTFGNILIILTILTEKLLRHSGNVFIINLAIADLAVTTFIDIFNILGAINGHDFYNGREWLCKLVAALCAPSCVVSVASICAVALNRYIRICHFNRYLSIFTWRSCIFMCLCIWVYAFLVHLPNHVGWGLSVSNTVGDYDNSYFICTFSIATYSFAVFYIGVGIFIPLGLMTFAYIRIYRRFRQSRRRVAGHGAVKSTTVAITSIKRTTDRTTAGAVVPKVRIYSNNREEEERKLIKTLFLVATFFVGCWAPFSLFVLLAQPKYIPGWVYVISIIMAHGNSSLNWILYGITSSAFRGGYRNVMSKIWKVLCSARIASRCCGSVATDRSLGLSAANIAANGSARHSGELAEINKPVVLAKIRKSKKLKNDENVDLSAFV